MNSKKFLGRLITYSTLVFYTGLVAVGFGMDNTSSSFTDTEISEGNTIVTGHWVVEPEPIEKDDCKKYGWEELTDPETGEIYRNQGECVSDTVPANPESVEDADTP